MSEQKKLLFGAIISLVLMIILHVSAGYEPDRLEKAYAENLKKAEIHCIKTILDQSPTKSISVDEFEKLIPCIDFTEATKINSYFDLVVRYSSSLRVEGDQIVEKTALLLE